MHMLMHLVGTILPALLAVEEECYRLVKLFVAGVAGLAGRCCRSDHKYLDCNRNRENWSIEIIGAVWHLKCTILPDEVC